MPAELAVISGKDLKTIIEGNSSEKYAELQVAHWLGSIVCMSAHCTHRTFFPAALHSPYSALHSSMMFIWVSVVDD